MKIFFRHLCATAVCTTVVFCCGMTAFAAAKKTDVPIQAEDKPIAEEKIIKGKVIEDKIDIDGGDVAIEERPRIIGPIKPPRITFEPIDVDLETPAPTPEPTPTPTPQPTVAPEEELAAEKEEQVEGNMVDAASATFSGITDISQCKWKAIHGSTVSLGKGRTGNGLIMTSYAYRWSTPAIDLTEYIKEPGTYTISLSVKARYGEGTFVVRNLIRSSAPLTFSAQHDTQNFSGIGDNTEVPNDEWTTLTMKLKVTKADVKTGGEWNFCFDGMEENLIDLSIDDFTVIKEDPNAAHSKAAMLYNPGLKGIAFVAFGATAAIVSVTISFKIVKDIFKKRREQP